MTSLKDIKSREDIKFLIDEFYKKVVKDDVIGYFFNDVVKLDWEKHIPVMYNFWESTLLGKAAYKGNPMMKHLELSKKEQILEVHFNRWLALWESTIKEHFYGIKADEAVKKAKQIGLLMKLKIEQFKS